MDKEQQKKLLIEIMEADEKDGLYKTNNMAQQTALQELIQYLDPIHSSIKEKAIELLEKEKEQIIDAYFQGFREGRGIDKIEVDGKIFYEDTNAERYYSTLSQPI